MQFNTRRPLIPIDYFAVGFLVLATNIPGEAAAAEAPATERHWAFESLAAPAVSTAMDAAWFRTPIDAFIAEEHRARGLHPAVEASRQTLIRRLSLDLIGLPPTPEEVREFLSDASPDAYERLVDRLLASPHYGERWGRHWLDVARWAESEGYENNAFRPTAWRYRDYVVRCFNEDRPFDQFLRQQIAGDELTPYSDENLVATGFLAAARFSGNQEDKSIQRNDVLVDITNATASAFLGLTLACAQCHDHKFDPLTQRDYYRFHGFFVQGQVNNLLLKDPKLWKEYEAAVPKELAVLEQQRAELLTGVRGRLQAVGQKDASDEDVIKAFTEDEKKQYDDLNAKIAELQKQMPLKPQTIGFYSPANSPFAVETIPLGGDYPLPYDPEQLKAARPRLLRRGDPRQPGEELDIGWPAIFGLVTDDRIATTPRTVLAEWLTSPDNPLTARVWANRVWQFHFGRGLVREANNFGRNTPPPSHPALLDYLASELIRSGWSTKHLHRLIVNSATYRQGVADHSEAAGIDFENEWYTGWSPRRLDAETIRDSLLAVSGELDRKLGGPSVSVGAGDKYKTEGPTSDTVPRRSLYLESRRDFFWPMYLLFDGPPLTESCARRHVSTVALQPLFLLNSDFMATRSKALSARVASLAGADPAAQVKTAYEIALGRSPTDEEAALLVSLYECCSETNDGNSAADAVDAIEQMCLVVLNVSEFYYTD